MLKSKGKGKIFPEIKKQLDSTFYFKWENVRAFKGEFHRTIFILLLVKYCFYGS